MGSVLRFAEFQASWWATALLARAGHGTLAALASVAYIALHLARSKRKGASAGLVVIAAGVGALGDGLLRGGGAIAFPEILDGAPSPAFMIALWGCFGCALETSLSGLASRPLVAATVGAVGGLLAYRGGTSLGVLELSAGWHNALAVAAVWAVATPLLGVVATTVKQEAGARRVRTLPLLFLLGFLFFALLPLMMVVGLIVDVVRFVATRRPAMSLRLLAFGAVYLAAELIGVVALAGIVVTTRDPATVFRRTYAVQGAWAWTLFVAVRRLFRLHFVVEGEAAVLPGPLVVLVRHVSIIDTLLPTIFVTRAHGMRLRFVLKKELLVDPCLDIAGNRLPNHFVSRKAEDTGHDLAAIGALAATMSDDEGALIYPEGTRFTPAKRARALEGLRAREPELAEMASAMNLVLPPKPGGVQALLEGCPRADVLLMAHTGLEGFARVKDVWSGGLLGRTVSVGMWRVRRSDIPHDKAARVRWLYEAWRQVDGWVAAHPSTSDRDVPAAVEVSRPRPSDPR